MNRDSAADPVRLERAGAFLQEAVYRSRGDQAGASIMAAGGGAAPGEAPDAAAGGMPGGMRCGLGGKPSVVLDLSPRAEELFELLFGGRSVDLDAIHAAMGDWVKRQDALDRRRNHFLKDFRKAHGMDRRGYSEAQRAEYESRLEAINAEVSAERAAAAAQLLGRGESE